MKPKLLLIYPDMGFAGTYVKQIPIGVIYAAAKVAKIEEIEVELFDCRVIDHWPRKLTEKLSNENVFLVGFSVLSGSTVFRAYEISTLVKSVNPEIKVVWGGTHPTVMPQDTMQYGCVDFCVSGWGSQSLLELTISLLSGTPSIEEIPGLSYRGGDEVKIASTNDTFEDVHWRDLPYHLIEPTLERYFEIQEERVFPIYTAFGCPYKCTFCMSPIWYKGVRKKWSPINAGDVVDHIQHLKEEYDIDFVYIVDDDTFVNTKHFGGISQLLKDRGVKVGIGVRGIRINEVLKLKPELLELMQEVGVTNLHIGVETGSQRMLDLMKKEITVEQTVEANKLLSRYPKLTPMYNILGGLPSESIDDLKATGRLQLKLTEDNPNCIVFDCGKYIPYPGGNLYDLAIEYGFEPPSKPEHWKKLDQEVDVYQPWYTPAYNQCIKMLQVTSFAISNWERFLEGFPVWLSTFYKVAKTLYKPIAKYRLRNGRHGFLIEYRVFELCQKFLTKVAGASGASSNLGVDAEVENTRELMQATSSLTESSDSTSLCGHYSLDLTKYLNREQEDSELSLTSVEGGYSEASPR